MAGDATGAEKEVVIEEAPENSGPVQAVSQSIVAPKGSAHVEADEGGASVEADELLLQILKDIEHEVNNMLTGLTGFIDSARYQCGLCQEHNDSGENRCARVVHYIRLALECASDMRAFFKDIESFRLEELDLSKILEDVITCRMHSRKFANVPVIEMEIAPGVKINGNRLCLKQSLSNLINNALDAMENITGRDPVLKIVLKKTGSSAKCIIRDNGCGIPDQVKEHLCRIRFTTKPDGHGHGRGLAITARLLEKMGTRLKLVNNADCEELNDPHDEKHGATAIIEFPLIVKDQDSL